MTEIQVVRIAYGLFTETRKFQEDFQTWEAKSDPEKTCTKFQAQFIKVQADIREWQQTSRNGGYSTGTSHNAMEMSMEFYKLKKASAEDCASITNLTTANITLTEQVDLYTNLPSTK